MARKPGKKPKKNLVGCIEEDEKEIQEKGQGGDPSDIHTARFFIISFEVR